MRTVLALILAALAANANAVLVCTSTDDHFDDADAGQFDQIVLTATWYVGHPTPSLDIGAEQYLTCAATGNELAYIRANFAGLPMRGNSNSRVVIWHGDNARFILDNLQ